MTLSLLLQLPAQGLHRQNSAESVRKRTGVREAGEVQGEVPVEVLEQAPGTMNEMVLCLATGLDRNHIRLRQISTPRWLRQQAASKMGYCFRRPICRHHRKNTPSS